jgi:hypothetical protein
VGYDRVPEGGGVKPRRGRACEALAEQAKRQGLIIDDYQTVSGAIIVISPLSILRRLETSASMRVAAMRRGGIIARTVCPVAGCAASAARHYNATRSLPGPMLSRGQAALAGWPTARSCLVSLAQPWVGGGSKRG